MNTKTKEKYRNHCIGELLKTRGVFLAVIVGLMGGITKAKADEPIWNTDGSYAGHVTDNGSYNSIWGIDGSYKGHIDKEWINPYVPKIDRGRD
jgi:hypothetical protein